MHFAVAAVVRMLLPPNQGAEDKVCKSVAVVVSCMIASIRRRIFLRGRMSTPIRPSSSSTRPYIRNTRIHHRATISSSALLLTGRRGREQQLLLLLAVLLQLALLLVGEGALELVVQRGDVGQFGALARLDVLLAELVREALLPRGVVEGADVHFIAAHTITLNPLVLVRVVKPLDSRVTLVALNTTLAVLPAFAVLERLAVLRSILEQTRRSAEVPRVMRINATLGVVAVLFGRAPAGLVEEHVEDVALLPRVNLIQFLVQTAELEKTLRHKVILNALVLKIAVHCFN